MIRERLATIASWIGAAPPALEREFHGVSTDSRRIERGQLFVALRGERFDAHAFLAMAAARGAVAAVVDRVVAGVDLPQLVVPDTLLALGELARHWRARLPARVVGVTGSNGKTTTRALIAAVLGELGPVAATEGNLNNEVGVPLTVLALPPDTRIAVLEMGCAKPGDIAYLARIGHPGVGVVTNVGPAHLERLGSLEGVARTKGEMYAALGPHGVAVINADDAFAPQFRELAGLRRRIEFGLEHDATVTARNLVLGDDSRFTLATPLGTAPVSLPLAGRHNVANALAAAAVGHAFEMAPAAIARGLARVAPVGGRLTRYDAPSGWTLFDDSYNANPASVRAGIATLTQARTPAWLVLGNMAELGAGAAALHEDIGHYARRSGIARLFAVGELAALAARAFGSGAEVYADRGAAAAALAAALAPGVRVLIKGSRSAGMESVVASVLAAHGLPHRGGTSHAA
jgi:UDP-N-acetylmuramoyl-tripeptide--D-alanyl-D-alanine ligase